MVMVTPVNSASTFTPRRNVQLIIINEVLIISLCAVRPLWSMYLDIIINQVTFWSCPLCCVAIGDRVQLLYPVVLQQVIVNKKYQMIRPNNLGAMAKGENKTKIIKKHLVKSPLWSISVTRLCFDNRGKKGQLKHLQDHIKGPMHCNANAQSLQRSHNQCLSDTRQSTIWGISQAPHRTFVGVNPVCRTPWSLLIGRRCNYSNCSNASKACSWILEHWV